MEEERKPGCQLRRRRCFANPNMALHFDTGYAIDEGCSSSQATPSPSYVKSTPSTAPSSARLLQDFKNRQQSFDIQVEDCEEIEIIIESDDEGGDDGEDNASAVMPNRPVTPTPVQDFGTSVVYTEGPQTSDFLKVKVIEQDCYTDVSDAGSEDEDDVEDVDEVPKKLDD
ncbi:uncharacterized protein [Maniola hyperantus]|uniref:uncharacterized protein n=1 Tax=Aphantopus hyperantus TaxID=2795564 RepID=UPI001569AED0|nr:uncharacterized protein LOC117987565 [Maniola hyperantus]XP_034830490.1 uncharacterized protein LOC117987565 [Maniola hyperantus]